MPADNPIQAEIAIVGAGIAGLVCALALAQRGREVTLIEAFDAPSEIGAGLQVPPNATHVLDQLGVLAPLKSKAMAPRALCLGDAVSGDIVLEMPVNADDDDNPPYLTAHRALLHGVLYTAMQSDARITPLTGHRVVDVAEDEAGVTLTTAHGGQQKMIRASCVVGADGIWSVLRNAVPGAGAPEPTGRIALRAVAPGDDGAPADAVVAWMAPGAHLITYPVRNAATRNLVAITSGKVGDQSWSQGVDTGTIDALFAALGKTPDAHMIERAEWSLWPLYAVAPGGAWHSNRIGLIGDAAHGIEPFAAQGAAMAVEDGYVLARMIGERADAPHGAFARFHADRQARIARVAKRTAFNRFTYHQSGIGRQARNTLFGARSANAFLRDLDWLYGYRA